MKETKLHFHFFFFGTIKELESWMEVNIGWQSVVLFHVIYIPASNLTYLLLIIQSKQRFAKILFFI